MSIHEIIAEKTGLARAYAEDGAFHSAAGVYRQLAELVKAHAEACNRWLVEGGE